MPACACMCLYVSVCAHCACMCLYVPVCMHAYMDQSIDVRRRLTQNVGLHVPSDAYFIMQSQLRDFHKSNQYHLFPIYASIADVMCVSNWDNY